MNVEIRKLTPDLAEDYAHFFDVTPHNNEGEGIKCYCVTWRNDETYAGDDHWFPTQEERREKAIQFVREGCIQGYLAYRGDEIVGWCNASGDCQLGVRYLRSAWPIEEYRADIKVKSVFCFTVAPQARRMGVATRLLERVCEDAANDGFDFVEAYVNIKPKQHEGEHLGHLAMYEKCGFSQCAKRKDKIVMRKPLK